jgi:GNAT superfamily N-acetyltransferase
MSRTGGGKPKKDEMLKSRTDPICFRQAAEEDAASVARLAGELGYATGEVAMQRRIRTVLASKADLLVVAVDSTGEAVGWLQAHAAHAVESGFRVEITGLVVSAEMRRRGVGRSLVARAERWAKRLSAKTMVVRSNASRAESHSFYPALGYRPAKTQVVYRKSLVVGK